MTRSFTGRHMLALMILFFGTIIAVNLTMATLATSTFGGTVVDNSYVASQRFNQWLKQARVQQALGWQDEIGLDAARRVLVSLSRAGEPLDGAEIEAVARHPVGRAADVELRFVAEPGGAYRSTRPLPVGRWLVHVAISREGRAKRVVQSLS